MRKLRMLSVLAVVLVLGAVVAASSFAQQASCTLTDQSTEGVAPGATLTWDSSFHCRNAPPAGTYQIDVTVSNHASSDDTVTVQAPRFEKATPRPRGQDPAGNSATAAPAAITLAPGQSGTFEVEGIYRMVETDEGFKVNHHLRAPGVTDDGERFKLGINVALRAPGVAD
jgi:predicted RecA/RadA family phage recombinase